MELLESAFDKELKKLKNNDLKQFTTFAFGNLHATLRRTQQVIGGAIGGDYGWVAFRKEWYSTTWKWITIPGGTTQKRVSRKWCSLFWLIRDSALLGVVIEGSPNKIVASDSIKKDLESFMTCVSKPFLSQMYDRFGFIVVFSLLFVQILTPLYYWFQRKNTSQ